MPRRTPPLLLSPAATLGHRATAARRSHSLPGRRPTALGPAPPRRASPATPHRRSASPSCHVTTPPPWGTAPLRRHSPPRPTLPHCLGTPTMVRKPRRLAGPHHPLLALSRRPASWPLQQRRPALGHCATMLRRSSQHHVATPPHLLPCHIATLGCHSPCSTLY